MTQPCSSNTAQRQADLSDVDFSPDGTYVVVSSTGSVPRLPSEIGETVCDAVARFDVDHRSPDRPVWINYTGGDTVWSVAATGSAVYAQGHFEYLTTHTATTAPDPGPYDESASAPSTRSTAGRLPKTRAPARQDRWQGHTPDRGRQLVRL